MNRKGFLLRFSIRDFVLLTALSSIFYPCVFLVLVGGDADKTVIFYSLIHALCSFVVLCRVVTASLFRRNIRLNMAMMFLLINLLYFNASAVKYFEAQLYPGFIENNSVRLFFSLLALFVLWISFEIVYKLSNPLVLDARVSRLKNTFWLKIIVVVVFFFIVSNIMDFCDKGFGYYYHLHIDALRVAMERIQLPLLYKINSWILDNMGVFLVAGLALIFSSNEEVGKWMMILSILLVCAWSMVSGSRSIIFYFCFGLIFSLIRLRGVYGKILALLLSVSPMLILILSVMILSFSGRVSLQDKGRIRHQLAYRFDLTDYAATLMVHNNAFFDFHPEIIVDAFYYSLPSVLFPSKYEANQNRVLLQLCRAGLDEYRDYTDTFFSIGVQLGGVIGFVFFPMLMAMFLLLLESIISRLFISSSEIIIIVMYPLFLRVETDLNSLFARWRMLPVYILFGVFIYLLSVRRCIFLIKRVEIHEH